MIKPTQLLCLGLLIAASTSPRPAGAEVLLSDGFGYPDGALVAVSSGKWTHHGGSSGAINVRSGHVVLSPTEDEDVVAPLAGAPVLVSSPAVLYASFSAVFTSLPSGAGSYFANFGDQDNGARALVFASTNGAAPGHLRLGATRSAVEADAAAYLPTELSLGKAYTVVTRYSLAGGFTTLWVDPASELDTRVNPSDPPSSIAIWVYGLRAWAAGQAGVELDDLRVGKTFGDVVDFPLRLTVAGHGEGTIDLSFQTLKDRYYRIETSGDLSSDHWQTLYDGIYGSGSTLLVRDTPGDMDRFYRLALLP